ncbi:alpha/beta fold hydrolase [Rhodococcus sp. ARC_M6]|uniref:alpha/beta fold hydrolase n=1 Tax=Rhodococcus sp. ARC_M6 TaxID=2928852 RepID=UPI001FB55441|nr:alpha/beta hydrolase [Rhodococcus sp. ARC_M6]MCJ0902507.1 alpha/beta hydrolase [Rhodococcus sp. ARC_M6]
MTNPYRTGRWYRRCGLVAAAMLFVLTGCTATPNETEVADPSAPLPLGNFSYAANPCLDPLIPGMTLPSFGADFTCGTLTVPQNREKPDGAVVTIPVARQRAQYPTAAMPPLLMLAGGPGESGLVDALVTYSGLDLNKNRDVIYIDQRATLRATPFVPCPQVDAFMQGALAKPSSDPGTKAASNAAVAACSSQFRGEGIDLHAFNSLENAADVASLRLALDIPEWDVYGVSYGSDVALQYLRDYPDGIRAVVADSVVPPQMNLADTLWPNAAKGFDALGTACDAQPACQAMLPDLFGTLATTVTDLDARPQVVSVAAGDGPPVDVMVDGYKLASLVNSAAMAANGLVDMPAIIAAAGRGDVTPAAQVLATGAQPAPVPIVGSGLTYGVICGEAVAHTSAEVMFGAAKKSLPQFPDAVLGLTPRLPWLVGDCAAWNIGAVPDRVAQPANSTVPVLLLSGGLDGVTPPGNAALAKATLPNAVVLTFPESGHGVLTQSDCGPAAVTGFLGDPSPSYRPQCLDTIAIPSFSTSLAGPA